MEHAIPALVIAAVIVVGGVILADVTRVSLIINYNGTGAERHVVWLPYTETSPPGDNEWTVDSIAGDYRNPGMLDTGEEMTVEIRLNPPTPDGPDRWLVLATQTGVAYSISFYRKKMA